MVQNHDGAQWGEAEIQKTCVPSGGTLGQCRGMYCPDHHHGCWQLALTSRAVPVVHDVKPDCIRHALDAVHRFYCSFQLRAQLVGRSGLSHQPYRSLHHGCFGGRRYRSRRCSGLHHGV
nr:hypothetical protein [Providencia rettgeri]